MSKTETIRARVEPELKERAEAIFDTLGLSPTEAITLFYKQVALNQGLPFEVKIPNEATREAIEEARLGTGVTRHTSARALLNGDDDA